MQDAHELAHLFDSVVGTVTLRVADLSRQKACYEEGIGLRAAGETEEGLELVGAPAHPLIRLDSSHSGGSAPVREPHTGLFHTAFRYRDRAALGAAVARVGAVASEYQGASDHGVSEAVYFADPEGNGIELYRDRPYEEWPVAEEDRVAMFTQPLDVQALVAEADDESPPPPDIGHIHLMTADVERALSFWRDQIGLWERQRLGRDAAFLAEGAYHHHIGVNSWQSAGARALPRELPGLDAFELRLVSQAAVEEAARRLEMAGWPTERGEGDYLSFEDPDSNRVVLSTRF
jgi:catechol 2,3-dioxygenase